MNTAPSWFVAFEQNFTENYTSNIKNIQERFAECLLEFKKQHTVFMRMFDCLSQRLSALEKRYNEFLVEMQSKLKIAPENSIHRQKQQHMVKSSASTLRFMRDQDRWYSC